MSAASPYVSPMWSDFDRFLDPARNPLARDGRGAFELFTAHRDGRAGRAASSPPCTTASNRRHGTRRGQFGFFDCADDRRRRERAAAAPPRIGCARAAPTEIVGNFNLTAMQMVGVVTDGFENAPYTDMMWSPPHIAAPARAGAGYAPIFPMTTFETDLTRVDPADLHRAEAGRRSWRTAPTRGARSRRRNFKAVHGRRARSC